MTCSLLVLVSLTLAGCGSSGVADTVDIQDAVQVVEVAQVAAVEDTKAIPQEPQDRPTPPQGGEGEQEGGPGERRGPPPGGVPDQDTLNTNKELLLAREEEAQAVEIVKDTSGVQRITASEVVYPAKVGDTVEAHPAWLTVTVTLEDDTITSLEIDQESSSPKSARHQAQFAQQIEGVVVGKKLSESNAVYLSVASSTSTAFNTAIKEIQTTLDQSAS